MTTPAQTEKTSPTTGGTPDTGVVRPASRRKATNGRRPNRPLVAPTRTPPRRSRNDAAPEPTLADGIDTTGEVEVVQDRAEPDAALATRVAQASRSPRAPRAPRRPRAAGTDSPATETRHETDEASEETTEPAALTEVEPDADTEVEAERASSWITRRPRLVGVAAVLAVALVAALVYSAWHMRTVEAQNGRLSAQSQLGTSALAAATTYGGFLSSYDYKTLHSANSAWAEVESNATASFKKDFTSTSGSLGNLLTQYNATATGKVVAAGLQSVSSSRAVVLLFIDQTVTNTVQKPNSVTQPLRVQLTMVRQNGKWLIDNLQVPN